MANGLIQYLFKQLSETKVTLIMQATERNEGYSWQSESNLRIFEVIADQAHRHLPMQWAAPRIWTGKPWQRFALVLALIISINATALPAASPSVLLRLHGDKTTLMAENIPLSTILEQFRQWNVEVDFMPDPDPRMSVRLESVDTEVALAKILAPYDYVLRWRMVPGTVGRLPKLTAIRLVGPACGQAAGGRPYAGTKTDARLDIMRHSEYPGVMIVRDELLLRVKSGVRIDAFERLLDQIGGGVIDGCPLVGVYRVRLRPYTNIPEMVARLRNHAQVDHVEPHWVWQRPERDSVFRPPDDAVAAATAKITAYPTDEKASKRQAGRLAVLDTGIRNDVPWHKAMHAVIDLLINNGSGCDTDGHGTRMAGLAGGFLQPLGIDPDGAPTGGNFPEVVSMKIFDDNGAAPLFAILQGIDHAIANEVNVISLSWGGPQNSRFIDEALVRARRQGVLTLAAAGNEPAEETIYPAASPSVLAVGALRPDGKPWEESGYGPSISLVAPGFAVSNEDHSGNENFAGTSVATAYAAGIFARYHALHGKRSLEENLQHFLDAMTPPDERINDPFPNAGRLDNAALQRLFNP